MYILFLVQKMMRVKQITRGGWSGIGTATVGIDPNTFEVLIGHPTKIPTDRILGDVVQNQMCIHAEKDDNGIEKRWRSVEIYDFFSQKDKENLF